jgi:glycosyltransferase involved in cell wall biosynthesis
VAGSGTGTGLLSPNRTTQTPWGQGVFYEIPLNRICVVGGGYDQRIFFREERSFDQTVHILYAGKFNRSKGVPWPLKSLDSIRQQDWHLHMAGSGQGPEFKWLQDIGIAWKGAGTGRHPLF